MTREERKQEICERCGLHNCPFKSHDLQDRCVDLAAIMDGYDTGQEDMLEKVYKWLDEEMEDYVERFNDDDVQPIVISGSYDYKKDFIEALRKAMEQ